MTRAAAFIKQNKLFATFGILALFVIFVACFPQFFATHDPYEAVMTDAIQAPSATHWFGTDKLGRDLFSRVIYGTRTSVFTALILVITVFAIGTFLGILAGYFGGLLDEVIMRICDMMISFPGLVIAIAIAGIMGANLRNAVIAIAVVTWPKYARLARSLVLQIRQKDYVRAAQMTGSGTVYILWKYMFRISFPVMLVTAVSDFGKMMLEMAALSFLGFGAQSPTPEWGLMMNEARTYLSIAPWMMLCPGIAMFLAVAVFNMFGDCARDLLDPEVK